MSAQGTDADGRPSAPPSADTVAPLLAAIADPRRDGGGGVAAALSLGAAAASAELVLELAAGRRSQAANRDAIAALIAEVRGIRLAAPDLAARDVAALADLLAVQRERRRATDEESRRRLDERLSDVLEEAASVPLALMEHARDLLRCARAALPIATAFTVSDLGVAGSLAAGAARAAELTARINLTSLDPKRAAAVEDHIAVVLAQVEADEAAVLSAVRERLDARENGGMVGQGA